MPSRTEEERQLIDDLSEKQSDIDCDSRVIKYDSGGQAYATYCSHESGWGTTHKGKGRCKLHGGASDGRPIITGVYSKQLSTTVAAEMERIWNDPNFGNLLEELAVAKALFSNLMEDASSDIEDKEFWEAKDITTTVARFTMRTYPYNISAPRRIREFKRRSFISIIHSLNPFTIDLATAPSSEFSKTSL